MAAFGRFGVDVNAGPPPVVPLDDQAPTFVAAPDPERAETRKREATLKANPTDVALATDVARRHIADARRNNDPRPLGWAASALAPWDAQKDAPSDVLLLRATIAQSRHYFDKALDDLGTLIAREPNHAQAALTRATVLAVVGRARDARVDCETLRRARQHPLAAAVCHAIIDGLTGKAEEGRERISGVLQYGDVPPSLKSWALGTRGELFARTGDVAHAEADLKEALQLEPNDGWTVATLADLFLDHGRAEEAMALVANTDVDNLLLRHALAHRALGTPHPPDEEILRARFAAAHARGDAQHLREESRFVLAFDADADKALTLALENWEHQKEPWDIRVALEAAVAAHAPERVQAVIDHVRASGFRDVTIDALIARLGR